jgi:protein phosphatase
MCKVTLAPGDRILLCSDGLTSMLDAEDIAMVLGDESDPEAACALLIDAANEAGGDDNITVVILDVVADDQASASRGAASAAPVPAPVETAATATAVATAEPDTATRAMKPDWSAKEEPPVRRPIRWGRIAVVAGLVVVVAVAALLGARSYVNRQWYVGESGGSVAIYNGIPTQVLGMRLSHVVEVSDVPVERATALRTWERLHDGITAQSLEDARAIVAQIEADTAAGPPVVSPAPSLSPATSPSPSG